MKGDYAWFIHLICCQLSENDCGIIVKSTDVLLVFVCVSLPCLPVLLYCAIGLHRGPCSPPLPVIIQCYWQNTLFYIKMLLCPLVFRGPSIQMRCEFKCLRVSGPKLRWKLCQRSEMSSYWLLCVRTLQALSEGKSTCFPKGREQHWSIYNRQCGGCLGSSPGYKSYFWPFEAFSHLLS